jgi:hypothetical protein
MYHAAVEVLAERDAVVFVEGWCQEDPDSGCVTDIDVTDFRLAPKFSTEQYRQGLGRYPDYTGAQASAEFVAEGRDG